jgi:hypothetical protein
LEESTVPTILKWIDRSSGKFYEELSECVSGTNNGIVLEKCSWGLSKSN